MNREILEGITYLIMAVIILAICIWQTVFIISNGQWQCLLSKDPMFCTKVMLKGE